MSIFTLALKIAPFKSLPAKFASLDALHTLVEEFMLQGFAERHGTDKEVPAMFFIVWDDFQGEPAFSLTTDPWGSEAEKDVFLDALWQFFQKFPPRRYAMTSETWFAEVGKDWKASDGPASKQPNRKDGLVVAAIERGGAKRVTTFEVKRNAKGRYLERLDWAGASAFGGRMMELMDD